MAEHDNGDDDETTEDAPADIERNDVPEGRRRDGRPFKPNNTRTDGSYEIGKYRPPVGSQFAVGDGRERGRREKGTKNMNTVMRKALRKRITIKGETKLAMEWMADQTVARAIAKSDRAVEIMLRHAGDDDASRGKLGVTHQDIVEQYMRERLGTQPGVSDDFDTSGEPGGTEGRDVDDQ